MYWGSFLVCDPKCPKLLSDVPYPHWRGGLDGEDWRGGPSRAAFCVAEDVSPDTRLKAGRGGAFLLGLSTNRRRNGLTGPSYATPASTPQHRIANPTRTSGVPKAETLLPGLFSPKPS